MKQHVHFLLTEINSINGSENQSNQKHINNIVSHLKELNNKLVEIATIIDTGNNALNNILNYKISVAKDLGVEIKPDIAHRITGIEDTDMIILIGNLLDNAIEECEKISDGEKEIIIKITKGRFYLNISVKNPTHCPVLKYNPDFSIHKRGERISRNGR